MTHLDNGLLLSNERVLPLNHKMTRKTPNYKLLYATGLKGYILWDSSYTRFWKSKTIEPGLARGLGKGELNKTAGLASRATKLF